MIIIINNVNVKRIKGKNLDVLFQKLSSMDFSQIIIN